MLQIWGKNVYLGNGEKSLGAAERTEQKTLKLDRILEGGSSLTYLFYRLEISTREVTSCLRFHFNDKARTKT